MSKIYYIILPSLLSVVFLSSCFVRPPEDDEKQSNLGRRVPREVEENSVVKLEEYLKEAEAKSQELVTLDVAIAADQSQLTNTFEKITALDFLDPSVEISSVESKEYVNFKKESKDILAKISAANVEDKNSEIDDLLEATLVEQLRLTDSIKVRKIVDQIRAHQAIAREVKDKIVKVKKQLKEQAISIEEKINDAAKEFKSLYGVEKANALDAAIALIPAEVSLEGIQTNILDAPQFFNLTAEIKSVPVFGRAFLNLFERTAPYQGIVANEIERVLKAATAQLKFINDKFLFVPTTEAEVDRVARDLDGILGNAAKELETLVRTARITSAEQVRSNEVDKILNPKPAPAAGGPPPSQGIDEAIRNFKLDIAKIKYDDLWTPTGTSKMKTVASKFDKAFKGKITEYYNPAWLTLIRNAAEKAADPKSPIHVISYDKLTNEIKPLFIENILAELKETDPTGPQKVVTPLGKNDDKALLDLFKSKNKIKKYVAGDLLAEILNKVEKRISDRLSFLANEIITKPEFKKIEKTFEFFNSMPPAKMNPDGMVSTVQAHVQACIDFAAKGYLISVTDNPTLGTKSTCHDIENLYYNSNPNLVPKPLRIIPDPSLAEPPQPLNPLSKEWDKVRRAAKAMLDDPNSQDSANTKEKSFEANLSQLVDPKNRQSKTDFEAAVNGLNKLLGPALQIDLSKYPTTYDYDLDDLIALIGTTLENQITGKSGETYGGLLEALRKELDPTMSVTEIKLLGNKIQKNSGDRLSNLSEVLSFDAFRNLNALLNPNEKQKLDQVANDVIATALGNVLNNANVPVGIPAFESAKLAVRNALNDTESKAAITALAPFLKDDIINAAKKYKTKVLAVAAMPIASASPNDQLASLEAAVKANKFYVGLNTLADLDAQVIAGTSSLEQIPIISSPKSLEKLAIQVPVSMKALIFGSGATPVVVTQFNDLKNNLMYSLEALKANALVVTAPPAITEAMVKPIVNAFSFLYAYIVDELQKLAFTNADDAAVINLNEDIDRKYINKFEGFKTVVGEKEIGAPATAPNRPIIDALNSLKTKLNSASTTTNDVLEIIKELKDYIAKFLL